MDHENISINIIDEYKANFEGEIHNMTNELGIRYKNIAEHTQRFEELYKHTLDTLCDEIDKGISANGEFALHCDVLMKELDKIENLAKYIHFMRKFCEEMEKKLIKIV